MGKEWGGKGRARGEGARREAAGGVRPGGPRRRLSRSPLAWPTIGRRPLPGRARARPRTPPPTPRLCFPLFLSDLDGRCDLDPGAGLDAVLHFVARPKRTDGQGGRPPAGGGGRGARGGGREAGAGLHGGLCVRACVREAECVRVDAEARPC